MPKAKAVQHKRARCSQINRGRPGLTPAWIQVCQTVDKGLLTVGQIYHYGDIRTALGSSIARDMETLQFELAEKRCPYLFRTVGKLYRLELRAA